MKKLITITALAAVIAGCGPEDSGMEATLVITEANAKTLVAGTMEIAADSSEFADFGSITRSSPSRDMASRASESLTLNCDSGSFTLTVTADDSIANATTLPANGSMSLDSDFNNCTDGNETTDGSLSIGFNWTGYSDTDDSFTTMTGSLQFDELSVESGNYSSMIDGDMTVQLTTTTATLGWDFYVSSSDFDGKTIHTYTKTKVAANLNDDYPYQGVWRVDGAEDTYVQATVVANGIEVVVNGGQATLYTWDEL